MDRDPLEYWIQNSIQVTLDGRSTVMNEHMRTESWNFKRHPVCNFTIPEELEFVERYKNGETFSDMAEEVGVSRGSLWKIVTQVYDIEPYQTSSYPGKYDIDINTFEQIDDERSAYALGLLVTDGTALPERNELHFYTTDKEQMDNFRKCLKCTKEPRIQEPRSSEIRGRAINGKKQIYELLFGPAKLTQDYLKHFPALSRDTDSVPDHIKNNEYVNHFIRGIIDGDGHISTGVFITGRKNFIGDIQKILIDKLDISKTKLHRKSNGSTTYDLVIKKSKDIVGLYDWLYSKANYFLSRKEDSFKKLVDDYSQQ